MSMSLMVDAMRVKVGNPGRKLVFLKLADNANDHGECWPSYQHIADYCEMSRRTVIAHINQLIDDGLVAREHRMTSHGNSSNIYRITINKPALARGEDLTPPGENSAPGGSDHRSPRTSHSFEPVNEPHMSSGDDAPPVAKKRIPYQAVVDLYNETFADTVLPGCKALNDKRKRAIAKTLAFLGSDIDRMRKYLIHFRDNASGFYYGDGPRGWRANFDYLMREDTVIKTREGQIAEMDS